MMNKELSPEELAAMAAANPMRVLSQLHCEDCGHDWQQPKPEGRCPRCHGERTTCYDAQVCVLDRR